MTGLFCRYAVYYASVIALLLVLLNGLTFADNEPPAPVSTHQTELTLTQFIQQVKQNHPVLKLAALDRDMASAKRLETQGAFDPSVNAEASFNRFNSSSAVGQVQEALNSRYSVDLLTRYGAQLSVGGKLATGDTKTPISPTGQTGEYFGEVTLPLLRGAWINPRAAAEKKALAGEPRAVNYYRQVELSLLLDAVNQYWAWIGSSQKTEVEQQLIDLAEFRLDAVTTRANAGDLAQITVVEAKRAVKRRSGRLYQAQRSFQKAAFNMALYLWDDAGINTKPPVLQQIPQNTDAPVVYTDEQVLTGKLIALTERPELKVLEFSREIAKVDRRLAKNNLLPRVDAFLYQGVETGADSIDGAVIQTGLKVSVPLRWRAAKGQLKQAEITLKKLDVQERQQMQQIFVQIEDSVSAINAAFGRYEAIRDELAFAKQLAEGERTKFDYGDSTLFLVNQRELAVAAANRQLIDALVDYHQAVGRFNVVTGQL